MNSVAALALGGVVIALEIATVLFRRRKVRALRRSFEDDTEVTVPTGGRPRLQTREHLRAAFVEASGGDGMPLMWTVRTWCPAVGSQSSLAVARGSALTLMSALMGATETPTGDAEFDREFKVVASDPSVVHRVFSRPETRARIEEAFNAHPIERFTVRTDGRADCEVRRDTADPQAMKRALLCAVEIADALEAGAAAST